MTEIPLKLPNILEKIKLKFFPAKEYQNLEKVKNSAQPKFKYNYALLNPSWIRLSNLWGVLALVIAAFGYLQFLNLNIYYLIFFSPLILINLLSNIFSRIINLFVPKFVPKEHEAFVKKFWQKHDEPMVDVFLPIAGEPIEVLNITWRAVHNLKYSNFKVYVLDDKSSLAAKNLAERYGFEYLARPNPGEFKKAGNLDYGYKNSKGEYILVLDADFVPIREALKESLPYIISKPKMSILQTPQYFDNSSAIHDKSAIEYGAATVVEEFYRVTQPSKSQFGLAMCVGTSAIYRREAVELVGVPQVEHTEDVKQGLLTMSAGYYVSFLPLIISRGICPDNIQTYYSQQLRWAYGSIETIFSDMIKVAKLNLWGKINFLSSSLYYITEATAPLLSLQLLALLYFNTDKLRLSWVLPFLPYLIYETIIKPRTQLSKYRYGTRLAGLTQMFTYMEGLIRFIVKKDITWQSTNTKGAKKQIKANYFNNSIVTTIFAVTYTFMLTLILVLKSYILFNFETYIVLGLAIYRAYIYLDYTQEMLKFVHSGMLKDLENKIIKALHFHFWRLASIGLLILAVIALVGTISFELINFALQNAHSFSSSLTQLSLK